MTRKEFDNLKVGDKVRANCDVSLLCGKSCLTKGKVYEVLATFGETTVIKVTRDTGVSGWLHHSRFDHITDGQTAPEKATHGTACDCGALVYNTTHAFWCSSRND